MKRPDPVSRSAGAAGTKPESAVSALAYNSLLNSLDDPVFVAHPATGMLVDANQKAQDLIGKPVEEIRAMHYTELHPTEQRDRIQEIFTALATRGGGRAEVVVTDRQGREVPTEVRVSIIRLGEHDFIQGVFQDVSRQKRIEEALREAFHEQEKIVSERTDRFLLITQKLKQQLEERYLSFLKNFHGIAFRCSMELAPTFIHGQIEPITGYTDRDFLRGRIHWGQLTHPDDRQQVTGMMEQLRRWPDQKIEGEYRIVRKKGDVRWVVVVARSIPDETGAAAEIEGAVYDVTERKLMKDLLAEKEETFSSLVENLNIGVLRTSIRNPGRFLQANPAAARIFGYDSVEELLACSSSSVYQYPADRNTLLNEIAKTGFLRNRELRLKKKDGTPIWCSLTGTASMDSRGRIRWIDSVIEDITERKKARQTLQESEARYRTFFENTGTTMLIFEEDTTITFVNAEYERLTGYSKEETEGKRSWRRSLPEKERKRVERYNRLRLKGDRSVPRQYETWITDRFGNRKNLFVSVDVIPGTKKCIASVMDITKSHEMTKAIRESESRYRAIVEDQTELICRLSPDHKLTFVNMAFCRCFGIGPEDLLGRQLFPLIHEEDQALVKKWLARLSREHPSVTYEHRVLNTEQKILWQEWTGRVLFDEQGRLTEYQAVGRDITNRKQAEEELCDRKRELEIRTRNLEEMNIALNVLFKKIEKDKREIEDSVITNLRDSVIPYLEKLKKGPLSEQQKSFMKTIERSMSYITSPFMKNLKAEFPNLSPKERRIADLIKGGHSTKEIGAMMNLSVKTIEFYREKLRIQFGIKNRKVNLKSYLQLLD
jgi:PAS domain S-box-containing protein